MAEKRRYLIKWFVMLALPLLVSCQPMPANRVLKVLPLSLPDLSRPVEPIIAGIPAQLSQVNFDDPIDVAILQSRFRFENGENLYEAGLRKRAKEEFDSAVDVILETASAHPKQPRLERELSELV